ncbi:MAG: hypothetical protein ACD_9C00030G0001, partial [uncultured bacterium]
TVTITAGAGVFSEAQTGNIGVGDRVTYNTSQIAYISAKTHPDMAHWSLVTATGNLVSDVTNATVNSITREFTSLSAAIAGADDASHLNSADLAVSNVVLNIPCYYDTGVDVIGVNVSGFITSIPNFIKVYTPNNITTEVNVSQRHQGRWNDAKYIVKSAADVVIRIYLPNVWIDGIQVDSVDTTGITTNSIGKSAILKISNNIVRHSGNTDFRYGILLNYEASMISGIGYAYNNIVYGFNSANSLGISTGSGAWKGYFYGNTVYDTARGIANGGGTIYSKNNITQNCGDGFWGPFDASSSYNISDLASDAPGANSKNGVQAKFTDVANKDFRLSADDNVARDAGADLSNDTNLKFSTDIEGQSRIAPWDIGADEGTTKIFYSVGQNTDDHKTGSPTVTVSGATATFSEAQTASNMGVGDVIDYDADNKKCFIAKKVSQTVWNCTSATGGLPTAASGVVVNSISHAFASLSAAITGASGASFLNTSDLVSGNYQLNFPCYYDSGADTTFVNVAGYTTGTSNYIKIYTPNNSSTEVNQGQRHGGKWDDGKYRLEVSAAADFTPGINLSVKHARIEGIQVKLTNNDYGYGYSVALGNGENSEAYVTQNVIRGNFTTTNGDSYFGIRANHNSVNAKVYISNNTIYDIGNGGHWSSAGIYINGTLTGYIYNNTIHGSQQGINSGITSVTIKNNLSYSNGDDYYGSFNAASANNLSKDATSPNVSFRSKTVSFVDATNKDFHLSNVDTAARDAGVDLSADENFPFSKDIDGQIRPIGGIWDMGADEAASSTKINGGVKIDGGVKIQKQ